MRISLILLGFLAQFNAFALLPDGSHPPDPQSEKTAIARAILLDPLGNAKQTKPVADEKFEGKTYKAITLEGGLQLHPSCELEAKRMGYKADQFKQSMNKVMTTMLDRIEKCVSTYPEMKNYLEQSVSQYRRQIVKCEPPKGQKGIIAPTKLSIKYWAYNSGSSITVTNSMLTAAISPAGGRTMNDFAVSAFFHELLHSTECNNRHDHAKVESIAADVLQDKNTCDKNTTMDRVSVVESLCMGTNMTSSNGVASELLARRMNLCGSDRGCRDMFTERGNSFMWAETLVRKTADLDDASASRLCQRIKDDGMCLHFRRTQGKTITLSHPKVKALTKRLNARIGELIPRNSNQIPMALLAPYPKLSARFEELKGKPCFSRNFYVAPDKPGEINALRSENKTIPPEMASYDIKLIPNHFARIAADYEKFINKVTASPECENEENETKALLNEIAITTANDSAFINLRFLIAGSEKGEDLSSFRDLKKSDSNLVKLLGNDLVQDYLKTMDTYHYESPNFDCEAAGLSPFRALERATQKPDACEQ